MISRVMIKKLFVFTFVHETKTVYILYKSKIIDMFYMIITKVITRCNLYNLI